MNETKTCVICGKEFKPNAYNNSRQKCCSKECSQEYSKKASLQYYYKNKEKRLTYGKKYREKHKTVKTAKCQICGKEFIKTSNNKYCSECADQYHKQQKYEYNKKYLTNKYKNDIEFKLKVIFRVNFRRCLEFIGVKNKEYSTFKIFGYTPNQLKQRLESQFKNGMTWENIGTHWEIHHKKPLYQFNFKDNNNKVNYHQIFLANCLANLQPLTIEEHKKIHI